MALKYINNNTASNYTEHYFLENLHPPDDTIVQLSNNPEPPGDTIHTCQAIT